MDLSEQALSLSLFLIELDRHCEDALSGTMTLKFVRPKACLIMQTDCMFPLLGTWSYTSPQDAMKCTHVGIVYDVTLYFYWSEDIARSMIWSSLCIWDYVGTSPGTWGLWRINYIRSKTKARDHNLTDMYSTEKLCLWILGTCWGQSAFFLLFDRAALQNSAPMRFHSRTL